MFLGTDRTEAVAVPLETQYGEAVEQRAAGTAKLKISSLQCHLDRLLSRADQVNEMLMSHSFWSAKCQTSEMHYTP